MVWKTYILGVKNYKTSKVQMLVFKGFLFVAHYNTLYS